MIQVDISNVWGEMDLPDLLAIEQETADAHAAVMARGEFPLTEEEIQKLQETGETICSDSEVCVVVGHSGAQGAIELLQGQNRNLTHNPRIFFAGNSFSTLEWNELTTLLEGKDFSVIVISQSGEELAGAIALRGLRWMLERKYGTEEAHQRIYAVTDPENGSVHAMAEAYGWKCFPMDNRFPALSAAQLLPMAVAGVDIREVAQGAREAVEAYDLRSFENPVWLYAAVRNVLYRHGKKIELLETTEPDCHGFGLWWQGCFAQAGGSFPVAGTFSGNPDAFVTMLYFDPAQKPYVIGSDWNNLDNLNDLEGKTLEEIARQAFQTAVEARAEAGIPVITMDCGRLDGRKVGELFYFWELCLGLSAHMAGKEAAPERYGQMRLRQLGRPETEKSCD